MERTNAAHEALLLRRSAGLVDRITSLWATMAGVAVPLKAEEDVDRPGPFVETIVEPVMVCVPPVEIVEFWKAPCVDDPIALIPPFPVEPDTVTVVLLVTVSVRVLVIVTVLPGPRTDKEVVRPMFT